MTPPRSSLTPSMRSGVGTPTSSAPHVALVDGNNHQISTIRNQADTRNLTVNAVIDFIHVLE